MKQPHNLFTVCVHCFTYNQSSFIIETLDGFTMQKTTFPYVCTIVDDASTDGEQNVINRYLEENFKLDDILIVRKEETCDYTFTYARHKRNMQCYFAVFYLKTNHYCKPEMRGRKFEYIKEWNDRARYIAICEGDDYWIEPFKLQNQVEILEQHQEIGMVYGKAKTFFQSDASFGNIIGSKASSFCDLIYKNSIPTLTAMYRKEYRRGYDEIKQSSWKMGDYPFWLYISNFADCFFMEQVLAVYRVLPESASHSHSYDNIVAFEKSTNDIRIFFISKYNKGDTTVVNKRYYQKRFDLAFSFNQKEDMNRFYPLVERNQKNVWKHYVGNHTLCLMIYQLYKKIRH